MKVTRRAIGVSVLLLLVAAAANAQPYQRYWADLQGDNRTGVSPLDFYTHARDSVQLDVQAMTPQSSSMSATKYANVQAASAALYAPGSFVTFSGFEWNSSYYGHKVAYFLTDDQPMIPPNEVDSNHPSEFFALMKQTNGMAHVAHPSLKSVTTNWNFHDPSVQYLVEVFSRHGEFETHASNGKAVRDAWARGYRLGVAATSDTDTIPGVHGGLTAVLASSLDRASIMDALEARRTYATTGARMGLDFTVNGAMMGQVVNDVIGDATVSAQVQGTSPITRIEVHRNNAPIHTYAPPPARVFAEVGGPLSYFKGQVEPPASWNQLGFNDAGWLPGRSGIGFGDNDDVTVITGMVNNYVSIYTRQTISVTDHAPSYLYLGADYDDGFIAYIDGVEVLRVNMPDTSFVPFDMGAGPFRDPNGGAMAVVGATSAPFYTADGTPTGTPLNPTLDLFDISEHAHLLTPGLHVLAIQVHNSFPSSGDLSMIPRLYEPDPSTNAAVNFVDAGASGDRFYDVTVTQLDGERAWSSPIWLNPDAPPRPTVTVFDAPLDNGTALDVNWTKSVASDFGYYNIYVSEFSFTDADGMTPWNSTPIFSADSLSARVDSLDGQPLERGKEYFFFVGAFDWSDKMNSTTFGVLGSGTPVDNLPPAAPAFTSATDTPDDDGGSIRVSWGLSPDDGAGAGDVATYQIFRRSSTGSYGSTPLATRVAGTTTYQDNTTNDSSTYFYRVRAHDGVHPSAYALEYGPVASSDNGGLEEPQSVDGDDVANDQGGAIEVTWDLIDDDASITRYLIFRTTLPGSYGSPVGEVANGIATFIDTSADNGTDYWYVVVADSAGVRTSTWSEEIGPVQSLDNVAPPRVSILAAENDFQGGSVHVHWQYDEAAVPDLDRYDIYYKDKSFSGVRTINPILSAAAGDTSATVDGLLNNEGYYFTVVPVDKSENFFDTSLETNWAKPTDETPPVFAGLESVYAGDASLTLGWTPAQDNTLPLTYDLFMSTTPGVYDFGNPSFSVPGSTPIIGLGESWRYFKGITSPPSTWNTTVYNDGGWLQGEGAFGYDSHTTVLYQVVTDLSDMENNYSSVFFRKTFELASIPDNLILSLLVDDGFIAYINGVEVTRNNLDDPVSHISLAEKGINAPWSGTLDLNSPTNYSPDPILKPYDISAFTGLLQVGENVLAVQVHNRKRDNPDMLFLATLSSLNHDFRVQGLDENQTYWFTMRAHDGEGNSETNTVEVSGQPLAAAPPAPVTSVSASRSGSQVQLSWSPVTTDSTGALLTPQHYNVYRDNTPDFVPDIDGHSNLLASVSALNYGDATAFQSPQDLYYRITAVSQTGRETTVLSPLAMKTTRTLPYVPGEANIHWINIPYLSGIPDAQTFLVDLNNGPLPGPVTRIERFDPTGQVRQSLTFDNGAWVGQNFPIASGQAYAITLQSQLDLLAVGAHNPTLGFSYAHNDAKSSFYMIGLPMHHDYSDAVDLLDHLNNGTEPDRVSKLVRIDPATGAYESYMNYKGQWIGTNFTLQSGQGYAIIVRSNISGWKPRTQ